MADSNHALATAAADGCTSILGCAKDVANLTAGLAEAVAAHPADADANARAAECHAVGC